MFTLRNTLLKSSFSGKSVLHLSKRTKRYLKIKDGKTRALEHFDDFYKSLFQMKWPSIRLALLSKGKNVAVLNNFGDTEKIEPILLQQGAFDFKKFLESLKSQDYGRKIKTGNKKENSEEIIFKKFQEEEEKEKSFVHPNPENIKLYDQEENVKEEETEAVYDITVARSSLHQDKMEAEYDTTRLIMPDNSLNKANIYDFLPATKLRGLDGYILESEYYKFYTSKKLTETEIVPENEITFPENLKVFSFDRGEVSEFPQPAPNSIGVYDYLLMDGSDILPVLALDVQPGDYVLHLGYNSGTMGYCLFQTLRAKYLVCSGNKDFSNIFGQYLFNYREKWSDMLYVTDEDFLQLHNSEFDKFDKILVDVPSTNDRNALHSLDYNLFETREIRTRLQLPKYQTDILVSAMNLVRPGGTIVYTTSTLSPVQNDSVVNEALNRICLESKLSFTLRDLSPALKHMSFFYNFDRFLKTKYGTLVLPFLPSNFGPRYFCKLIKKE